MTGGENRRMEYDVRQSVRKYDRALKRIHLIHLAINRSVCITACLLLVISGYALYDSQRLYADASAQNFKIYDPEEYGPDALAGLQAQNPDVIGWIHVNDTRIDYPLLQCADNQTYLTTNAKGEYSASGSIYMDCRNTGTLSEAVTILYGHYMQNDAMFGGIGRFTDSTYFAEHMYGQIYIGEEAYGIEFFALAVTDAYDETIYDPDAESAASAAAYLYANALQSAGITIGTNDRLVLLSTCTADMTTKRYVLAGRLSEELHLKEEQTGGGGAAAPGRAVRIAACAAAGIAVLLFVLAVRRQKHPPDAC